MTGIFFPRSSPPHPNLLHPTLPRPAPPRPAAAAADFNFLSDPEAAQLVLSAFSSSSVVTKDLCVRHSIPWPTVEAWLEAGTAKAAFLAGAWVVDCRGLVYLGFGLGV